MSNKTIFTILIVSLSLILVGCNAQINTQVDNNKNLQSKCGDGICDAKESSNPDLCQKDCENKIENVVTSSELSYSFGIHPSSAADYLYADDLGLDFNREGTYFIWNWSDQNKNGSFSFKKAIAPAHPDNPNSGGLINYDKEQEKLASNLNIEVMHNVCPFRGESKLNNNLKDKEEGIYKEYIGKLVERYDGDSDLGCTQSFPDCYTKGDGEYPSQSLIDALQKNPILYWQVCNQVTDTCYGKDCKVDDNYAKDYANVLELSYSAVKSACPECQVMIAGDSSKDMYPPVYKALNGQYVDIIDKHFFGIEQDYIDIHEDMAYLKDSLKDNGFDLDQLRFWITETGTYSGDPQPDNRATEDLPYQSEKQQAQGLVKRHIVAFGEGVEKVFWAWGAVEGFGCECCIFDYTGLVYDGNIPAQNCDNLDYYDLGKGVKKLAYFSYKLMINKIGSFTSLEKIQDSNGVYIYKFNQKGKSIWIAWSDNGQKIVSLNDFGISNAKITETVPDYTNGKIIENNKIAFEDMFKEYIVENSVQLGEVPIFIE